MTSSTTDTRVGTTPSSPRAPRGPSAAWLASLTMLALALTSIAPGVARADEPGEAADPEPEVSDQARLWNRLLAVEIQGAIDGPLGVVGGSIVISPLTNLALEIGGGASRDGARVAGGFRIMLPQDHFALALRMGVAAGPLTWDAPAQYLGESYTTTRRWEFQAGMYADIGLQYRFDMGLYIGLNGGVEAGFASTSDSCSIASPVQDGPTSCPTDTGRTARIYLALSLGYAFDLRI